MGGGNGVKREEGGGLKGTPSILHFRTPSPQPSLTPTHSLSLHPPPKQASKQVPASQPASTSPYHSDTHIHQGSDKVVL